MPPAPAPNAMMRRATVIATCLLNSSMVPRLEDGEARVRKVFEDDFPGADFQLWNVEIGARAAGVFISNVGRAMTIRVDRMILQLALID
jgi:hypothetical protein